MVKTQPWAHGYVNVINFRNDVGYLTDVGIVERYDVAMPYPGNLFVHLFYTEAPRGIVDIGLLAGLQHHLVVRLVAPHFYRTTYKAHRRDRKSTRLNSSHANISYAVFCLKK